jgi:membrane protein implicated in regulation of membrane protease activity
VTAPVPRGAVDRELARARGARKMLPWTALTAVGGAAIGLAAGGGAKAAGALFALGLVFALFLWTTSVPRCPACGARLPAGRARLEGCPGCRARFE